MMIPAEEEYYNEKDIKPGVYLYNSFAYVSSHIYIGGIQLYNIITDRLNTRLFH